MNETEPKSKERFVRASIFGRNCDVYVEPVTLASLISNSSPDLNPKSESDGCGTPQDPADRAKGTWDCVGTVDDWIVEEYIEAFDLSDAEADYIDAELAASEARALDAATHD